MGPPASRTFEILIRSHTLARALSYSGDIVAHLVRRDNRRGSPIMSHRGSCAAEYQEEEYPRAPARCSVIRGIYGQIRLMVTADGSDNNSYIDFADGSRMGLRVPSSSETGFKLVSGFTVPSSGVVDYTIDFDLRKAITCPPGQAPACILKPVERLVDITSVGNVQGQITSALPSGGPPGGYLYSVRVTTPEDWNSTAPSTDTNQPLTSTLPVATSVPPYAYRLTALPPGTYTLAFTCQAALDNPAQSNPAVTFSPVITGIVVT